MIWSGLVSVPHAPHKTHLTAEPQNATELRYPGYGKIFLIWTAIGVLTSLRYQLQRPSNSGIGDMAFIAAFTASYYPWVALTPFVFRIEKRFPLGHGNWVRNLILLAIISLPVCLLASPLMSGFLRGTSIRFRAALHAPRNAVLVRPLPHGRSSLLVQRRRGLYCQDPVPVARTGAASHPLGPGEIATRSRPEAGATGRNSRAAQPALSLQQPAEHLRDDPAGSTDGKSDARAPRRSFTGCASTGRRTRGHAL